MATVESSLAPILEPTPEIEAAWDAYLATRETIGVVTEACGRFTAPYYAAIDAAIEAERALEQAIPMRAGLYRLGDKLVGHAKVDKSGLTLVKWASAWSVDHPEGRRWRERQGLVGKILSLQGVSR